MKQVDFEEPTSFFDHVSLGRTQRECQTINDIVDNYRVLFESRISAGGVENCFIRRNLKQTFHLGLLIWKVMQGHAWEDIANLQINRLNNYKVATPCIDDHQCKEEEIGSVGELSKVCAQMVLKFL